MKAILTILEKNKSLKLYLSLAIISILMIGAKPDTYYGSFDSKIKNKSEKITSNKTYDVIGRIKSVGDTLANFIY